MRRLLRPPPRAYRGLLGSALRTFHASSNEAEWRAALEAVMVAADRTSSRLDREDGGPIPTGVLLDVLMPYANEPPAGELVCDAIEQALAQLDVVGTYYSTHADYTMRLARVRHASGNETLAREAWARAAVFLVGYGWRKDITVFDVIESAPALVVVSREAALKALADVQPLANAVLAHTDGRSTNHAPNAWLRSLLTVHPAIGIALLARTIAEEDGQGGWPTIRAVQDAARQVREVGDPGLIDAVLATLRFKSDSEGQAVEAAGARLAPVIRLADVDRPLARQAIRRVAAEVSGDGSYYSKDALGRIEAVATAQELPVPASTRSPDLDARAEEDATRRRLPKRKFEVPPARVPAFAPDPSFIDLLAGIRAADVARRWDDIGAWDEVVLALSYHVGSLIEEEREDDARRLLRFFARDIYVRWSGREHPLAKLAAALENAGFAHIAAFTYALAYTATRGGGYLSLGGRDHAHLIARGVALDCDTALQAVLDEVAYSLRGSWYSVGTSQHLIELLAEWGEPSVVEAAWREAFAVVAHRLPLIPSTGWFAPLDWEPAWTVDESFVALLLAKLSHPLLARKISALAGVVRAIRRRPDAVAVPLRWWLSQDTHVTSILLVLDALVAAEAAPFRITQAVDDLLLGYAGCGLWGVRRLALRLLDRAERPVPNTIANCPPASYSNDRDEPTTDRQRALLSADVGAVLDRVAPMWPDLPRRVARRLHALFKSSAQQERAAERFRLSDGRDGNAYPRTPTLLWQWELFQVALHEAMCDLGGHLWVTGQWEIGLEDSLLDVVLPNARLQLGLHASRAPRPSWPSPADCSDGLADLQTLGADDPQFAGWTRLALVERQYVSDPARPHSGPVELVTLFAGAVAVSLGVKIPCNAFPLAEGDVEDWWQPDEPPGGFPSHLTLGPMVRLARVTDWLGDAMVLIPPPELRNYMHLDPPRYAEPMVWFDSSGSEAIVLRSWRVLSATVLHTEPVVYQGADLIARPDTLARLGRFYHLPFRELRVVQRLPHLC